MAESWRKKRSRLYADKDEGDSDQSPTPTGSRRPQLDIWVDVESEINLRHELSPAALAAWEARRPVSREPFQLNFYEQQWLDAEEERWDLAAEEVAWAYDVIREDWPPHMW